MLIFSYSIWTPQKTCKKTGCEINKHKRLYKINNEQCNHFTVDMFISQQGITGVCNYWLTIIQCVDVCLTQMKTS